MSVDGYGTEADNNAVLNSVTRPLTTLNSGVFALGVAKRPNMERAEPLRKDPVERLMAGLCMRLYLKIFAQPENRRRFPTAHQTFGRNFDGLRLLRPIFLDDTKMRIAMTLTRKNKEPPRCWRKTRSSRSHVRAETAKKKPGIKTRESAQQSIAALQTRGGWAKPQWFTRLRRDPHARW